MYYEKDDDVRRLEDWADDLLRTLTDDGASLGALAAVEQLVGVLLEDLSFALATNKALRFRVERMRAGETETMIRIREQAAADRAASGTGQ